MGRIHNSANRPSGRGLKSFQAILMMLAKASGAGKSDRCHTRISPWTSPPTYFQLRQCLLQPATFILCADRSR